MKEGDCHTAISGNGTRPNMTLGALAVLLALPLSCKHTESTQARAEHATDLTTRRAMQRLAVTRETTGAQDVLSTVVIEDQAPTAAGGITVRRRITRTRHSTVAPTTVTETVTDLGAATEVEHVAEVATVAAKKETKPASCLGIKAGMLLALLGVGGLWLVFRKGLVQRAIRWMLP